MIEVGNIVRFDPFEGIRFYGVCQMPKRVIGKIVYVHRPHHWFTVEYGEERVRTSFHFCDIGNSVKVVG